MRAARIAAAALALAAAGVLAAWAWPKSRPLDVSPTYVGHYRGFGLRTRDGYFGRSYYRVTITDEYGRTEVQYSRPGYNRFGGFYRDGGVREEGECRVELTGHPEYPLPDLHDVRKGRYYRPDGTLGSEVKHGTGVQTYWTTDGIKIWELELRDFERVRHSVWYPNGRLKTSQAYADGRLDGPFVSYFASGAKKTEGAYAAGARTGKWVRYDEDGTVAGVEEYAAPSTPSTPSTPAPGRE